MSLIDRHPVVTFVGGSNRNLSLLYQSFNLPDSPWHIFVLRAASPRRIGLADFDLPRTPPHPSI